MDKDKRIKELEDKIKSLTLEFNTKEEQLLASNEELQKLNDKINEQFASLYKKEEELIVANRSLKAKEERLKLLNEENVKIAKIKGEFLSNMSHELRTPLNSILGFSELLLESSFGSITDKQTKFISNIIKSGNHLLDLINDILDLSKIESGKDEILLDEFGYQEVLTQIFETLSPQIKQKKQSYEIINNSNADKIEADITKFRQILLNVVGNAVKYTDDGGNIKIEVEDYVTETGENYTCFKVIDNGIGIKKEDYSKVFNEFEQIANPYKKKNSGTGLGLALTKRLVERHKGDIWFRSKVGVGSTFYIIFPRNIAQKQKEDIWQEFSTFAPQVHYSDDVSLHIDTVFVLEKDEQHKEEVAMALSEEGYRVVFFEDFESIKDSIKSENPALVMLNTDQDDGPGVLYPEINNMEEFKNKPVMFMSGNDDKRLRYRYGFSDVLLLPASKDDICQKVRDVIDRVNTKTKKREIVIVDDDINIIELVYSFFENEDINIVGFADSRQGLKYLEEKNNPDLVILDLIMPEMNGFEMLKELDNKNMNNGNIVIFSMKELTATEKKFLNKRVLKVIDKTNFSRETFVRQINNILANR